MRHLIDLVIYLALVIILYDCGSRRTIAVNQPSAPLGKYTILEVKNVGSNIQNEDALEAAEEFPEMIVNRFVNYKDRHPQEMFFSQITRATDEINRVLVLDCILVGYEKGSRAKRYFFNCFGLGKAYTTLQCSFIEKATGQQVLKTDFEGELSVGFFGGTAEGAQEAVVEVIIEYIKKLY